MITEKPVKQETTTLLVNKTIKQYTDILQSDTPTPGGGSALAHVGSCAVALILMAINVTKTKLSKKDAYHNEMENVIEDLLKLQDKMTTFVDTDTLAFNAILNAMRMPKDTIAQQEARKAELQRQYYRSALLSLDMMKCATEAYLLADKAIAFADRFVVSDAHIGKSLAKCVAENCTHNVDVNADCIFDLSKRQAIRNRKNTLLSQLNN